MAFRIFTILKAFWWAISKIFWNVILKKSFWINKSVHINYCTKLGKRKNVKKPLEIFFYRKTFYIWKKETLYVHRQVIQRSSPRYLNLKQACWASYPKCWMKQPLKIIVITKLINYFRLANKWNLLARCLSKGKLYVKLWTKT